MDPERFRNRNEAGRRLAEKLAAYANRPDVLVLALPRGGVPVAYEVSRALGAPFDVFVVRKLGIPGTKSWRWVPLQPAACVYSTTKSCSVWVSQNT
jgi:predicted phosphoribosyltransferase